MVNKALARPAKVVARNTATPYRRALVDIKIDDNTLVLTPREMVRKQFAINLNALLKKAKWRQSDLAKHAGIGRDLVNAYARGRMLPSADKLTAMAKAFDVEESVIMPVNTETVGSHEAPKMAMKITDDGNAWIQINRFVTVRQAGKIWEILSTND